MLIISILYRFLIAFLFYVIKKSRWQNVSIDVLVVCTIHKTNITAYCNIEHYWKISTALYSSPTRYAQNMYQQKLKTLLLNTLYSLWWQIPYSSYNTPNCLDHLCFACWFLLQKRKEKWRTYQNLLSVTVLTSEAMRNPGIFTFSSKFNYKNKLNFEHPWVFNLFKISIMFQF